MNEIISKVKDLVLKCLFDKIFMEDDITFIFAMNDEDTYNDIQIARINKLWEENCQ